jgi:HPt (histidine-containing phosphotransfer) domain-containing protein
MDAADPTSIDALLAAAHSDFAASLPGKVEVIEGFVAGGAWAEARRAAHKLRGSAATYGFVALSACAAAIEEALLEASVPGDEVRARVAERLVEARAEAALAARPAP